MVVSSEIVIGNPEPHYVTHVTTVGLVGFAVIHCPNSSHVSATAVVENAFILDDGHRRLSKAKIS